MKVTLLPGVKQRENRTAPLFLNAYQITLLLAMLDRKLTPDQRVEAKALKASLRDVLKYLGGKV